MIDLLETLNLTHPEVEAFLGEASPEEIPTLLQRALEVGCTVIRRIETDEHADYLERRISHTVQRVEDAFDGLSEKLNDQLTWQTDPASPLARLHSAIREEILGLRDAVVREEAISEIIQKTALKGAEFEEEVWDRLQKIAKPHSDAVEDTRITAEAVSGSKKGDYVYTVEGIGRIVIDAKNHNRLGSLPAMLSYIKEAILQRTAGFGIIVAPDASCLQKQIGEWNVYEDKIITTLDNLELSLRYAKFVMDYRERSGLGDSTMVQEKLATVRRYMKDFSTWKSKLTKLQNGVSSAIEDIKNSLDSTKAEIERALESAQQGIKSS